MCESHLRWGTFIPNLGAPLLWVLELFAMYVTDEQTDGRTKATLIAPSLRGRGHKTFNKRLARTVSVGELEVFQHNDEVSNGVENVRRRP